MPITSLIESFRFTPPLPRATGEFGLRFRRNGKEFRLLQISGGAERIRLEEGRRRWWCKIPTGVEWEIYEAVEGQTYPTRDMAKMVARNLTRL